MTEQQEALLAEQRKCETIIEPGIYPDFPIEAYLADPCVAPSLSQSLAKILLDESPAHAAYAHPRFQNVRPEVEPEEKYTKARAIGDVAHKLILGRGKKIEVCPFKDWRTNVAKDARAAAIQAGKIPVLEEHFERAQVAVRFFNLNMRNHEVGPLPIGQTEVVIAWREDGFWFRAMIDHLSADRLFVNDLKTTARVVPPQDAGKKLAEDGWDIQAAMIDRGLNVLDPKNAGRRTFRFISIEQDPPFGLVVNQLSEAVMTTGRRKLQLAVNIWKDCFKTGTFPGYPPYVNTPEYPAYALSKWEDRERMILWEDK